MVEFVQKTDTEEQLRLEDPAPLLQSSNSPEVTALTVALADQVCGLSRETRLTISAHLQENYCLSLGLGIICANRGKLISAASGDCCDHSTEESGTQTFWIQALAPPHPSCVTWDSLPNVSVQQMICLPNSNIITAS